MPERREADVHGFTGDRHTEVARATLQLASDYFSIPVLVASMDSLSKQLHTRVDGVLGMDALGSYSRIEIDLKDQVLTLTR